MQRTELYPWAGVTGIVAALALISQTSPTPSSNSNIASVSTANETRKQEKEYFYSGSDTQVLSPQLSPQSSPQTSPQLVSLSASERGQASAASAATTDYFMEIALGAEWGDGAGRIHRWHKPSLRIGVQGRPTEQDWRVLRQVSAELSTLTGMVLVLVDAVDTLGHANTWDIAMHFRPEQDFVQLLPHYQPGNQGFAWSWWGENGIEHATILIASQGIKQIERSHLIREELTQSLGLMQDSWSHADSIFYQGWTTTSQYSSLDKAVIQLLYHPSMRNDMTAADAYQMIVQQ